MKIKTGSKNSKIGTPKVEKIAKPIAKAILEKKEKAPRVVKQEIETVPTWVRESSEKKPKRAEGSESKLQWRKETKKSQRSFSKNKEREYISGKSGSEGPQSESRGSFRNTFDKDASYQSNEQKSSWDPRSKKPGTGFEKSKTGYKGVGSAWDKSTAPRVPTRTWDDIGDKPARSADAPQRAYTKSEIGKNASPKELKTKNHKTPYIAPKPTWEKETEVIDKKKLIDPTK